MQELESDLPYGTVPGTPRSDSKPFFGLYLYLAGRCCNNPQNATDPAQCKSSPGKTWLV